MGAPIDYGHLSLPDILWGLLNFQYVSVIVVTGLM
jgi:hypothetical protein